MRYSRVLCNPAPRSLSGRVTVSAWPRDAPSDVKRWLLASRITRSSDCSCFMHEIPSIQTAAAAAVRSRHAPTPSTYWETIEHYRSVFWNAKTPISWYHRCRFFGHIYGSVNFTRRRRCTVISSALHTAMVMSDWSYLIFVAVTKQLTTVCFKLRSIQNKHRLWTVVQKTRLNRRMCDVLMRR